MRLKLKKEYKIDKLEFLFSILESIIKLNDVQKTKIIEIVEHLVSRKEIRVIPIVERAWHMASLILLPVTKVFFWKIIKSNTITVKNIAKSIAKSYLIKQLVLNKWLIFFILSFL